MAYAMYTIKPFGKVSLYTLFKANGSISYLRVYFTTDNHIFIHRTRHGILAIHIYTLSYCRTFAHDTCLYALFGSLICLFVYMFYLIIRLLILFICHIHVL